MRRLGQATAVILLAFGFVGQAFAGAQQEGASAGAMPTLEVYGSTNVEDFPEGKDENNNFIIEHIREVTGYNVQWAIQPRDGAVEKLNLLMASGDTPDIIQTSTSIYSQFVKQGVLAPLDDAIAEHGEGLMSLVPEQTWFAVRSEGAVYAVPMPQNMQVMNGLYARVDWLERLGLPVPTTLDEFYEVLVAIDGASEIDGDPIPYTAAGLAGLAPIMGAFGVAVEYPLVDGRVVGAMASENARDFLEFASKLYREGLIDAEFVVNKGANVTERLVNGAAAMAQSTWIDGRSIVPALAEQDPDAKIAFIAPPIGPDGESGVRNTPPIKHVMVVPVFSDKVNESIDFLNTLATDQDLLNFISYGREGDHYDVVDGVIVPNEGATEIAWQVYYNLWDSVPNFLNRVEYKGFGPYYNELIEVGYPDIMRDSLVDFAPPIEIVQESEPDLEDLTVEYFTKIITGALPLSAFDEYVDRWNAAGGTETVEALDAWYQGVSR